MAGWDARRPRSPAVLGAVVALVAALAALLTPGAAAAEAGEVVVATDRAAYRPGDTIRIASFDRKPFRPVPPPGEPPVQALYQLVDPFGQVLAGVLVPERDGAAHGDLPVPADAAGGRYLLRVRSAARRLVERPLRVSVEPRLPGKSRSTAVGGALAVEVRADRSRYRPGERATLSVVVRDAARRPVAARVALAVVDAGRSLGGPAREAAPPPEPGAKLATYRREPPPRPTLGRVVVSTGCDMLFLDKVYFAPGQAVVRPTSRPILDTLAADLKRNPRVVELEVIGRVDRQEARQKPELGRARAQVVIDELVRRGLARSRFVARGETAPLLHPPGRRPADRAASERQVAFRVALGADRTSVDDQPRRFTASARPPEAVRPDTVHWDPSVVTGADGRARVSFTLPEAVGRFRVVARAVASAAAAGVARRAGHGETVLATGLPLTVELDLPTQAAVGDRLLAPVTVRNHGPVARRVRLEIAVGPGLVQAGPPLGLPESASASASGPAPRRGLRGMLQRLFGHRHARRPTPVDPTRPSLVVPAQGGVRLHLPVRVTRLPAPDAAGRRVSFLQVTASAGSDRHAVRAGLRLAPRGAADAVTWRYERARLPGRAQVSFELPTPVPGSLSASLEVFPRRGDRGERSNEDVLDEVRVNGVRAYPRRPRAALGRFVQDGRRFWLRGLEGALRPGQNRVELRHERAPGLLWQLRVDYRARRPLDGPTPARLSTRLERTRLRVGETTRLHLQLRRGPRPREEREEGVRRSERAAWALVIGLPAGLRPAPGSLAALRARPGVLAVETRPRAVVVHLRPLREGQVRRESLTLEAVWPGETAAPPSSVETATVRMPDFVVVPARAWAEGVRVVVGP